jgi:hypothetical protein
MKLSRKAIFLKALLGSATRPLLAADSKIDLSPVVADVTPANLKAMRPKVLERLNVAAKGKLAQDAALDADAIKLALDEAEEDKDSDAEDEEADAEDEDPEEAARLAKEADDKRRGKNKRRGRDEGPDDKGAAMDAAISAAVRQAEDRAVARMAAVHQAVREVRPFVGDLAAPPAEAAAVYRLALDHLKVDLTGIPEAAFGAVLRMQPKPDAVAPKHDRLAADSAIGGLAKRFGDRLTRITLSN